jgi:hypothetical protein
MKLKAAIGLATKAAQETQKKGFWRGIERGHVSPAGASSMNEGRSTKRVGSFFEPFFGHLNFGPYDELLQSL